MLSTALWGSAALVGGTYIYAQYAKTRSSWRFEDIGDQSGKVVICTGANTGIGFHFCRHMARKKAHVILACRNLERGNKALEALKKEFPEASAEVRILDTSSKKSVKEFAEGFLKDFSRLDILVNNAGVMMQDTFLVDGVDNTFATNNFGPFLLTGLLLPRLEKTAGSRIVNVASGVHRNAEDYSWEDLNNPKLDSIGWKAKRYSVSKSTNITFTRILAKRLAENGSKVVVLACHPGWAATELQERVDNKFAAFFTSYIGNPLFSQSAEMGAAPTLMAATQPNPKPGDYYGPGGLLEMNGWPKAGAEVAGKVTNDLDGYGQAHWKRAEEWTGFKFKF